MAKELKDQKEKKTTKEAQEKIFWKNAAEFWGLNLGK